MQVGPTLSETGNDRASLKVQGSPKQLEQVAKGRVGLIAHILPEQKTVPVLSDIRFLLSRGLRVGPTIVRI
jgi:hypothetical protein